MNRIIPLVTATATALAGRNGHTQTSDAIVKAKLSLPKELGGPSRPGAATPEHFFAAGYAACFGGAFDFVAKQKKRDAPKPGSPALRPSGRVTPAGFGLSVKMRIGDKSIAQVELAAPVREAHEN